MFLFPAYSFPFMDVAKFKTVSKEVFCSCFTSGCLCCQLITNVFIHASNRSFIHSFTRLFIMQLIKTVDLSKHGFESEKKSSSSSSLKSTVTVLP